MKIKSQKIHLDIVIFITLLMALAIRISTYHLDFIKAKDWLDNHEGYVNRMIYSIKITEITQYDDFYLIGFRHIDDGPIKGFGGSAIINSKLLENLPLKNKCLLRGTKLKLVGEYSKTAFYANPGVINPETSLWANRQIGDFRIVDILGYDLPPPFVIALGDGQKTSNLYLNNQIDSIYSKTYSGVIKAMVLGDKSNLSESLKENFKKHGLLHLLAISGLHVSILYMFLHKLLLLFIPKPKKVYWMTMGLLLIYNFLIGYHISCMRATFMLLILNFSIHYNKPYHNLRNLFLILVSNLLIRPWDLLNVGFLLSYGAVASLYLIFPRLKEITREIISNRLILTVVELGLVTFSVNLGTLPILLNYFHGFSWISVFSNFLLVPLFMYQYIIGICGLILSCLSLPLGSFVGGGSMAVFKVYTIYFSMMGSDYYTYLGKLSFWEVLVYYLLLYLVLTFLVTRCQARRAKNYDCG